MYADIPQNVSHDIGSEIDITK